VLRGILGRMASRSCGANSTFEFRAWGDTEEVRGRIEQLAAAHRFEHLRDRYLLVDDPTCNAKLRRGRLKVKQLVERRDGFERWSRRWYGEDVVAPEPLAGIMAELTALPARRRRNEDVLHHLAAAHHVRMVAVTKDRQHYRVGSMRAELTVVHVTSDGRCLTGVAIEGSEIDELLALRTRLGLDAVENIPVHLAIGPVLGLPTVR
jgi:hypothetical protein